MSVKDTPVVAPAAAPVVSPTKEAPFTVDERTPCHWELSVKGDGILARNSITGRTFEGTSAEFSRLLKGE